MTLQNPSLTSAAVAAHATYPQPFKGRPDPHFPHLALPSISTPWLIYLLNWLPRTLFIGLFLCSQVTSLELIYRIILWVPFIKAKGFSLISHLNLITMCSTRYPSSHLPFSFSTLDPLAAPLVMATCSCLFNPAPQAQLTASSLLHPPGPKLEQLCPATPALAQAAIVLTN